MENNEICKKPEREISVVTAEIKELKRQAQTLALMYVIEIGRRLAEAKSVLPHGEWTSWLKNEVEFSQSTANNFMRLYDEYGPEQISIFGANVNSQTIANLPYSKALKLLALPADERESFAEEVDAEHISVKELESAIKEKNAAEQKAKEESRRAADLEIALENARQAAERAQSAVTEVENLRSEVKKIERSRDQARESEKRAKESLKAAKENPEISEEQLLKIKHEAEKEASAAAESKVMEKLKEAQERAEKAEQDRRKSEEAVVMAKAELEEARKKLKTANPDITAFKALFDTMQNTAAKLKSMVEKIETTDPDTADKLKAALRALGDRL